MDNPIYIGNGILEQINRNFSYPNTITKESVFNTWMDIYMMIYIKH